MESKRELGGILTDYFGTPDYLHSDLIDDDVKALFKDTQFFSFEPIIAQLVKELRRAKIHPGLGMKGIWHPTTTCGHCGGKGCQTCGMTGVELDGDCSGLSLEYQQEWLAANFPVKICKHEQQIGPPDGFPLNHYRCLRCGKTSEKGPVQG